ncbi:MAG: radical SAM protein [Candidatus Tectomicrobia bacterium]|nr:radical SAM protein [Candidatus Tectomicrobia bacterium]
MISISRLYCGAETSGDSIRYGRPSHEGQQLGYTIPKSAKERRPVTVWNVTRTCNLHCIHCYTDSEAKWYPHELTTDEAKTVINNLAEFQIPALLFSGGEPLARKDLFELVAYARESGIRPTLSTNGTLISEEIARKLKEVGFTYVGISLDGIGEINDFFRGKKGAFDAALRGFRNCTRVGQRVGLRLTLTRHNFANLHDIFDFIEREKIDRACFYHLVYSGRGRQMTADDLTHEESRQAMDIILERTEDFHQRGLKKDILTVDNHVDGVYLYLKLREKDPERAEEVLKMLEWNGGGTYSSGVGIGDIDFMGNVHADQFWMHYSFGNVKKRKFSEIWTDTSDPLMAGLKERKGLLKGRCSACKWLNACGGALRVRADLVYKDPWAPDPACYLSDEEIGLTEEKKNELAARGEEFSIPEFEARTGNGEEVQVIDVSEIKRFR